MEGFIVAGHVFLNLLFTLYLLIILIRSFWLLKDRERQLSLKRKLRYIEWPFLSLILLTGAYPVLVLGSFDLYHGIKILFFCLIIWGNRFDERINFTVTSVISITLMVLIGFISFTKSPSFKSRESFFDNDNTLSTVEFDRIEQGRVIFTELCSTCHGADGKLRKFQAADLSITTLSVEERAFSITNGVPLTVMPPFKNRLSPEEIEAVALFIEELKN